ncbi:MAG: T9SS type A sorting domain-containing protein, partial [Candidatus Neomarinimicrobiota bacterium]
YLNGGRILGGDHGDLDGDGNVDFVFGSRYSGLPNAMMFRVEYKGSGDIADPASWELTFADSAVSDIGGLMWNVIDIANVDEDPEDELVYTSSISSGSFTHPIVICDFNEYTVSVDQIFPAASFELGKAYPNPFNPSTMIPFTLDKPGNVTLTVFDVKGRNVETLISNEAMEAGQHNMLFNATDLASGVYVYQLRVDNSVRAAKMVLNK